MSRRLSLFDSPFLLGFDQFERALDRAARASSEGYPPYNIEQLGETQIRITIAVAGFSMEDLSVQLEQNQLVIRGKRQNDEDESRVFLHRGIATRQFQRAFILSEDIEVVGAQMDNGLLHVDLRRIMPETTVQTIRITSPKDARKGKTIDVTGEALGAGKAEE
ncbi:MAG TPA: Hsp20 family protein [Alphaproteobacteria bacterium]|nr:heat-shock protein Hsp20 [Rhodospirillaceae bacterium]HRJ65737.1 Hsp20 family protein [Alphaproteobacteria bacterium]